MQEARQAVAIEGGTTRDQSAVYRLVGIVEERSDSGDELGDLGRVGTGFGRNMEVARGHNTILSVRILPSGPE